MRLEKSSFNVIQKNLTAKTQKNVGFKQDEEIGSSLKPTLQRQFKDWGYKQGYQLRTDEQGRIAGYAERLVPRKNEYCSVPCDVIYGARAVNEGAKQAKTQDKATIDSNLTRAIPYYLWND